MGIEVRSKLFLYSITFAGAVSTSFEGLYLGQDPRGACGHGQVQIDTLLHSYVGVLLLQPLPDWWLLSEIAGAAAKPGRASPADKALGR